jgi:glycosyltransferase involved in cell wall biosynthesis
MALWVFITTVWKTGVSGIKKGVYSLRMAEESSTKADGVSVIVCSFNGAGRIGKTLEHLGRQSVPEGINWEIIVVDNHSTDGTAEVAYKEWKKLGAGHQFTVVREDIRGTSAALRRGVKSSRYNYILLCADDNWLSPDYVRIAYERMTGSDHIGIIGGQGIPEFESQPPPYFSKFLGYLGVGKALERSGRVPGPLGMVYGAGMVLRKEIFAALEATGYHPLLTGARGKKLLGGEDCEHCYIARFLGYDIWFEEMLTFRHYLEKHRLNWFYLKKLFASFGCSFFVDEVYRLILQGYIDHKRKTWSLWRLRLFVRLLRRLWALRRGLVLLIENRDEGEEVALRWLLVWSQLKNFARNVGKMEKVAKYLLEMSSSLSLYTCKKGCEIDGKWEKSSYHLSIPTGTL